MSLVKQKNQGTIAGFGLVEVMITLAITSIGLLGMAQMMILSQQNTSDAAIRTTATIMAQDMVNRIIANSADSRGCQSSNYHINGNTIAGATGSSLARCFGATSSCTPSEMATQDIFDWKTNVNDPNLGVPGGIGVVCCTATLTPASSTAAICSTTAPGTTQYSVRVYWNGRDGASHYVSMNAYP